MSKRRFSFRLQPRSELILTLLALTFAVAVPALTLLWSTQQVLEGESRTLGSDLAALHQFQLETAALGVAQSIQTRARQTVGPLNLMAASELFHRRLRDSKSDGLLILDPRNRPIYPAPSSPPDDSTSADKAADELVSLFHKKTITNELALAYLELAGDLAARNLEGARSQSGRLFLPGVQLAAISLLPQNHPQFLPLLEALNLRVHNYSSPLLPASQRLFLWQQIQTLGAKGDLPSLAAERMAIDVACHFHPPISTNCLERSGTTAPIWQILAPGGPILSLFHEAPLRDDLEKEVNSTFKSQHYQVQLRRTQVARTDRAFLGGTHATIGVVWPGWELYLPPSQVPLDLARSIQQQSRLHWTTAFCAVALGAVLAALAIRRFIQQAQLTQLRHDFLSTVTHELRTPLTSIRLLVDSLAEDPQREPERTQQYLEIIARENLRLSRLVDDFLTFSRLESGRMNYEFHLIAPEEIVEAATAAFMSRFTPSSCDFKSEVTCGLPQIQADVSALTTALINLLENAHKYTGTDKKIYLSVTNTDKEVCFAVVDNGSGFDLEHKDRLFEKFYRAENSGYKTNGVGLGLHLVKAIVDAHRGRIEVQSTLEQGSRFAIYLPSAPLLNLSQVLTPS